MLSLLLCVVVVGCWPCLNIFTGAAVFACLVPVCVLVNDGEAIYMCFMETDLGCSLIALSLWAGALSLLVDPFPKHFPRQYKGAIHFLVFLLIVSFLVSDGMFFFFSFEACVFPIGLLVLCWGHSYERTEALMYLVVYTMVGGALHLVSLLILDSVFGSTSFLCPVRCGPSEGDSFTMAVWWVCLVLGFFIKAPCYGLHLWLPKAHVEASVGGSMLLAAVLLKLGTYGLFCYGGVYIPPLGLAIGFQVIGVLGAVLAIVVAIRQVDLKGVIAYTSVSHMSLSVGSLLVFSHGSGQGVFLTIISHGLTASGLFAWAGILYPGINSRNLMVVSGLRGLGSAQYWAIIVLIMANCGMPPFLSFFGEILTFSTIICFFPGSGLLVLVIVLLGLFCMVYLFIVVEHSSDFMPFIGATSVVGDRQLTVLWGHIIPLVLYFFYPPGVII